MIRDNQVSNNDLLSSKQLCRYLSIKEAAALLKVSQKTIRRWDASGKIICSRTPGNQRRISMSEIVRLQARQDNNSLQITSPEPPEIAPSKRGSSYKHLPWRHDIKALKAQVKVLHYLLMNSYHSDANLTILIELMEIIKEIMLSIEQFRPIQSECLQLWERIHSGLKHIKNQQITKQTASTDIGCSNTVFKKRTPPKNFTQARENAHDVFFRLVKASIDSRLDLKEQERVHAIMEHILTPYQQLTKYLIIYPKGTLAHDVTKLLLTSHPCDYNIMRNRWSVRTLELACQQIGTRSASKSQIGRFYKEIRWYRKIKQDLKSPDPQFGAKMKAIGTAIASLKENDVLLYGDEFKFTSSKITQYLQASYAPDGLHSQLNESCGTYYSPACAIQITGVFDPIHHRLETTEIPDLTFESYAMGLGQLCRRFLKEITGRIVLIIDNASDHSPELLQPYVYEHFKERVLLLYLPTYSPNSNPIEGIWNSLLISIVRQCTTQEELRTAFLQALMTYQTLNSKRKISELIIHCPICHERFNFSKSAHNSVSDEINKHICFNISDLTPYTIDVLTHSLEVLI